MTQGAPKNNAAVTTGDVLDIDALLAKRFNTPAALKLGGKTYSIRRDLTPTEVIKWWQLATDNKSAEGYTLLLVRGTKAQGEAIHEMITALPGQIGQDVIYRIARKAGISLTTADLDSKPEGEDEEGNSSAS